MYAASMPALSARPGLCPVSTPLHTIWRPAATRARTPLSSQAVPQRPAVALARSCGEPRSLGLDSLTEEESADAASVIPEATGLRMNIFLATNYFVGDTVQPHLMVATWLGKGRPKDESRMRYFSLSISDDPVILKGCPPVDDITEEDVEQVKRWIVKRKEKLLAYWRQEIDLREAVRD